MSADDSDRDDDIGFRDAEFDGFGWKMWLLFVAWLLVAAWVIARVTGN